MIVDVYRHIGTFKYGLTRSITPKGLVRLMDEAGVDKALISQLTLNVVEDNKAVSEAVKTFPQRLLSYAHIDSRDPGFALKELDRSVNLGFVGVKMHSNFDHFVPWDENVFQVMENINFQFSFILEKNCLGHCRQPTWQSTFLKYQLY